LEPDGRANREAVRPGLAGRVAMSTTRPKAGRFGIERSSCLAISTPPLQFRRRRLMWFGGGLGIHGRESRRRVRRCLGDNCQSSAQTGPVGSRQLKLVDDCGESGLVGCSCGLWNDCENDYLSKRCRRGRCVWASSRPVHHPDHRAEVALHQSQVARPGGSVVGDDVWPATDRLTPGTAEVARR
jgi:hypothetical protein